MAHLLDIEAEGFLSVCKRTRLTLGGRGPVAIVGPNGSGKSTIISKALAWCLYGTCSPERMGSGTRAITGKAVISWGATAAKVTVRVQDDQGVWTISRQRGAKGGDVVECSHSVHGVLPLTDTTVESIIGVGYDAFVCTVLRGQNDPWNFAEATDRRKREIVDTISGAIALDAPYAIAKAERADADGVMAQARADVDRLTGAIETSRSALAVLVAKGEAWQAEHDAGVAKAELAVAAVRERLKEAGEPFDVEPYEATAREAREEVAAAQREHVNIAAKLKAAPTIGEKCPYCDSIVKRLPHGTPTEKEAKAAEHRLGRAKDHAKEAEAACKEASAYARSLPDRDAIARELHSAEALLAQVRRAENPAASAIAIQKTALRGLECELAYTQEALVLCDRTLRVASAWETTLAPNGVRAQIADATLVAIENAANHWLGLLSDGQFQIEFPPVREVKGRLKEEIRTVLKTKGPDGVIREQDFLYFSGGERSRINLAVDLGVAAAFSKSGMLSLSLLVLDEEVFSGLDARGKALVAHAIANTAVADVVIVDHDAALAGALGRTVRVRRGVDGYTEITEE